MLNEALERSRAVNGVVTVVDDKALRGRSERKRELLIFKTLAERLHHKIDNVSDLILCERLVIYYLVKTVQKFRPERLFEQHIHLLSRIFGYLAVFVYSFEYIRRTEVGREYYYRVLEIYRASLAVRYASVVEDLQQYVESNTTKDEKPTINEKINKIKSILKS